MGEEIGERGSWQSPEGFRCSFQGFWAMPTVGTEESIKNHPEATTQIPKSPNYHPQKPPPEDAPFFILPTEALRSSRAPPRIPMALIRCSTDPRVKMAILWCATHQHKKQISTKKRKNNMIPARGPQTGVLIILTLNFNLILNVNLI